MTRSLGQIEGGGSPVHGEPLPVEFANTLYAQRGVVREGIGTPGHLAAWLRDNASALGDAAPPAKVLIELTEDDVVRFRALRDAIRQIAAETTGGPKATRDAVTIVNDAAAASPAWSAMRRDARAWRRQTHWEGTPVDRALAHLAEAAIALFAGPLRDELKACNAPGCILFFIKDHPRRAWCSDGCGNRARQARHYTRHRTND